MRSRILSLWLPNLATDRLLRRAGSDLGPGRPAAANAPDLHGGGGGRAPLRPDRPLAICASQGGALRLAAVCPQARQAGLAPGMMLADARALLPALQVHPAEPAADARLLDDLATWCERYTPAVALDRSAMHDSGGALWLDVTGCAHLFGSEAALRADLLARLRRRGLAAEAAIADSPGAAWAAARYAAAERQIVPPDGAGAALAPLPVAALRLDPELGAMLERLGLARIESLYP
ncbi:MAG TPA: hypothetical protein VLE23_07170, partial [Geminicoccaceae bacterium]|nr:hypothetical protein [Geminicoccaceae bacterium]